MHIVSLPDIPAYRPIPQDHTELLHTLSWQLPLNILISILFSVETSSRFSELANTNQLKSCSKATPTFNRALTISPEPDKFTT